jgi:hypothetical protein
MLGREVSILLDGQASAGEHHVQFDGSDLPSGLYFYRLEASGVSLSRTMLLAK